MKKVLLILSAACFTFVVACGPSEQEIADQKKQAVDSAAAAQHAMDSIADMAQKAMDQFKADSTAKADAEKAVQDSIAAAKNKPVKKKTNEQKMQEDKKVLEKQKG